MKPLGTTLGPYMPLKGNNLTESDHHGMCDPSQMFALDIHRRLEKAKAPHLRIFVLPIHSIRSDWVKCSTRGWQAQNNGLDCCHPFALEYFFLFFPVGF